MNPGGPLRACVARPRALPPRVVPVREQPAVRLVPAAGRVAAPVVIRRRD